MKALDLAYYIYYPIAVENTAAARRAVMALFDELKAASGISGRLVRRRDDLAVWMEIYEHVSDAGKFEQALHAAEARHGLDMLVATGASRKIEVFIGDVLDPSVQVSRTSCA